MASIMAARYGRISISFLSANRSVNIDLARLSRTLNHFYLYGGLILFVPVRMKAKAI